VVEGDQIKGVLSLTDLKRISFVDAYDPNEDTLDPSVYSLFTLDQVMVSNPVTIDPNTPILEVDELFSKSEFHSAPVVEDGIMVGIVTTTDLIRFLIDQY
jgi:CBS domain-containing protein